MINDHNTAPAGKSECRKGTISCSQGVHVPYHIPSVRNNLRNISNEGPSSWAREVMSDTDAQGSIRIEDHEDENNDKEEGQ